MCIRDRLKAEVAAARQRGYENTQIVAMSETYFEMADETVSAAEHYSETVSYTHLDVYKRQILYPSNPPVRSP